MRSRRSSVLSFRETRQWALVSRSSILIVASHTRAVSSYEAEAIRLPSGDQPRTAAGWACRARSGTGWPIWGQPDPGHRPGSGDRMGSEAGPPPAQCAAVTGE